MAFDFITSIIIVLAAAVVGRYLSKIFKQPVILGELILGAIVGNILLIMNDSALNINQILNESVVKEIAYIGIFFLLFSAVWILIFSR